MRASRPCEKLSRTVVVPCDILDALQPDAAARDMSVNKLVREILAQVADDKMTSAILDD